MENSPLSEALLNLNPSPTWIIDRNSMTLQFVNQAFSKLTGFSLLSESTENWQKVLQLTQYKGNSISDLEQYLNSSSPKRISITTKTKQQVNLEIQGQAIRFKNKDCLIFFGKEVTDIEVTLNQLSSSENRFRTIFEIASMGIAQVNPSNGKIILINSHYESITGYSLEELKNMSFQELTHPEDREKDWLLFNKALRGEEPYKNEKRYIRKDGTIIWVRIHLAFIRDEQGNPLSTVALCEDITERKEIELRLNDLSDNLPGVVFQYVINPDGTDALRFVSKGAYKIWGYSSEEAERSVDLIWNLINAESEYEKVRKSVHHAVNTKSKWQARYKVALPNGEIKTHLGSGTPSFLPDGTIIFNSVILDITNEAKNEELLYQATKMARIGSCELNLDIQEVSWSAIFHEIHETDPDTFIPNWDSVLQFYHHDFRDMAESHFRNCMQEGTPFDFEAIIITTQNHQRWVRAIGYTEAVKGVNRRLYLSYQDIHQQKTNELNLSASLKKLQDYQFAIDQSASFTITDPNGIIISVNDKFCELSQYSREELIGGTHKVINSKYHPKEFFTEFWQTIKSGKIWRGEVRNQKKDGTYYWVDTTIVPFLDEDKKPFQFLALRMDITARKQAEQKNKEAHEKLINIAWTQSHVVRAPLARILGIISIIEMQGFNTNDLPFWLENLKISTLEMDEIIREIVREAQIMNDSQTKL